MYLVYKEHKNIHLNLIMDILNANNMTKSDGKAKVKCKSEQRVAQ